METRENLTNYVFGRFESLLNENGIYTGKGSPYNWFLKELKEIFQKLSWKIYKKLFYRI